MVQPVNFVDEQNIPLVKVCEQGGEITGTLDHGSRGGLNIDSHFARDDVGERCFAQPGRAVKKNMVENVAPRLSRGNGDLEVFFDGVLADVLVEAARPQGNVEA